MLPWDSLLVFLIAWKQVMLGWESICDVLLWLEGLWMWSHARIKSSLTLTSIWRFITWWCSDLGVVFKWAIFLHYAKLLLHYQCLGVGVDWSHIEKADPRVGLVYVTKCGRVIFLFQIWCGSHVAHVLCTYELESLCGMDIYAFYGQSFWVSLLNFGVLFHLALH